MSLTSSALPDAAAVVKQAGVVGAGGAGFPTYVKMGSRVRLVIANGAECDLLMKKDQEVMTRHAEGIVRGLELVMQSTGADRAVIALKRKYAPAWAALEAALGRHPQIELFALDDFYPAGDEFILVNEVTGCVVPEGGLPLDCGVVVQNVETLWNVARAMDGSPVTHKYVSVMGEVSSPGTYLVPLGMPVGALVGLAGAASDVVLIDGGAMMGKVVSRQDPVTKTTGGILVLPPDNPAALGKTLSLRSILYRARSVCIQCRACTDMCPRYLLGHSIEPHRVMRTVAYGARDTAPLGALLCSLCGLCQFFACPMGLSPARVNEAVRIELSRAGTKLPHKRRTPTPRPLARYRRVPSGRLAQRLGVARYDVPVPYRGEVALEPESVLTLPLGQGVGRPAVPVVRAGEEVSAGQVIAEAAPAGPSVPLHAPADAVVRQVTSVAVTLEVRG